MSTRVRRTDESARADARALGVTPDLEVPFPGVGKPWPSTCAEGHRWEKMRLGDLVRGVRCPQCVGAAPVSAEDAVRQLEAAGYVPLEPYPGIHVPWRARHVCGEERRPTLHNVRNHGAGCKLCDARQRAAKTRTSDAEALRILEQHGGERPSRPFRGKLYPWEFHCKECGALQSDVTLNRVEQGLWSCRNCRRARRDARWSGHIRKFGWTLLEADGTRSVLARHSCGLEHRFTVGGLGRYGSGCPACARSGFRSTLPAYLYLLRFPAEGAVKVGISNYLVQRLTQHAVHGRPVEVAHVVGPCNGSLAAAAESIIVDGWRSAGIPTGLTGPGETESAPLACVDIQAVVVQMDELCKEELAVLTPSELEVRAVSPREVRDIIVGGHYSHSSPGCQHAFGLFASNQLVGAATFGRVSYPSTGADLLPAWRETLELRRLYVVPATAPNVGSWFLARCIKMLPGSVELVLAFSDPAAGHHGGVYQAANFVYAGQTGTSYHYEDAGGAYIHKRGPWARGKASGRTEQEQLVLEGLVRVDDPPKYRYAFARGRCARRELAAVAMPYPKPDADVPAS